MPETVCLGKISTKKSLPVALLFILGELITSSVSSLFTVSFFFFSKKNGDSSLSLETRLPLSFMGKPEPIHIE